MRKRTNCVNPRILWSQGFGRVGDPPLQWCLGSLQSNSDSQHCFDWECRGGYQPPVWYNPRICRKPMRNRTVLPLGGHWPPLQSEKTAPVRIGTGAVSFMRDDGDDAAWADCAGGRWCGPRALSRRRPAGPGESLRGPPVHRSELRRAPRSGPGRRLPGWRR